MLHPDDVNLLGARRRPDRSAHAHRHGVPEAQPVPEVDLRERRLRPARARRAQSRRRIAEKVEQALRDAALWDEVKDRLHEPGATSCPAASSSACASPARWRPTRRSCCSTSRPRRSTRSRPRAIEELITTLRDRVTILIVTHNMQQAARVSRLHRLHVPGRADRVRRDRRRSSRTPRRKRRKITSPAATAEARRRAGRHACRSRGRPHLEGVRSAR